VLMVASRGSGMPGRPHARSPLRAAGWLARVS